MDEVSDDPLTDPGSVWSSILAKSSDFNLWKPDPRSAVFKRSVLTPHITRSTNLLQGEAWSFVSYKKVEIKNSR